MSLVYGRPDGSGAGMRPCVVDPPLVLAPMAGITDMTYRLLLRRIGGVGLVTMEFVSSEGLTRGNRRTERLLRYDPAERPLSIQIYGADSERMAVAAARVEEMQIDACDINMGCPANKVLKGCAGAGLMRDLDKARAIVAACKKALPTTPLTVKFRLGINDQTENYLELARICEGEGAAAVALHARTAKQMYAGRADWSKIARLKETVPAKRSSNPPASIHLATAASSAGESGPVSEKTSTASSRLIRSTVGPRRISANGLSARSR